MISGCPGVLSRAREACVGYRPPRVPNRTRRDLMPGGEEGKRPELMLYGQSPERPKTPISPQVAPMHCTNPRGRVIGAQCLSQREGSKSKAAREQGTETIPASRRGVGSAAAVFGGDVAPRQGHRKALPHAGGSCTVSAFAQHPPGERQRAPKPPGAGGVEGERRSIKMRNDTVPALPLT